MSDSEEIYRATGNMRPGQPIWGFVNGIRNTKQAAFRSAELISEKAGGDLVLSLPNDTMLLGIKDIAISLLLKLHDTPIVLEAAKFLRHLLHLAGTGDNGKAVVVFAHSQGAAITVHALKLLDVFERQRIRMFTFGGWSFVAPGAAHPDSHNYASEADLIPRIGSINLHYLALAIHQGLRNGKSKNRVLLELSRQDAVLHVDSLDSIIMEKYTQARVEFYQKQLGEICNVTVLETKNRLEHSFNNESYQKIVGRIVKKYHRAVEISPGSTTSLQHVGQV